MCFRREENAEVHRGPQTSPDDGGDDDFFLGDPSVANGDVGTLAGDKQAAKDIGCRVFRQHSCNDLITSR